MVKCKAITKKGTRCRNNAKANGYCGIASHASQAVCIPASSSRDTGRSTYFSRASDEEGEEDDSSYYTPPRTPPSRSARSEGGKCKAITAAGTRCKNSAKANGYCWISSHAAQAICTPRTPSPPPPPSSSRYSGGTCQATTGKGTRCKNKANANGFCWIKSHAAQAKCTTVPSVPVPPSMSPSEKKKKKATSKKASSKWEKRSRASSGAALLIGSSQNPKVLEGFKDGAVPDGITLRNSRYKPRSRGDCSLPDVLKDVHDMKNFFESPDLSSVDVIAKQVGKDGSNYMTRKRFFTFLDKLFATPGKSVYILYYAGHGQEKTGALCLENDEYATFDEVIERWENRPTAATRRQYFVWVADSCFSGKLVENLKNLPPTRRDVLNVAIQAACGPKEVSWGGTFTETFIGKQSVPPKRFQWKREFKKLCDCKNYFDKNCRNCRYLNRICGYPMSVSKTQHPTYFCTWGAKSIDLGDEKTFHFFKRGKWADA